MSDIEGKTAREAAREGGSDRVSKLLPIYHKLLDAFPGCGVPHGCLIQVFDS
jgi:hypothetical protein